MRAGPLESSAILPPHSYDVQPLSHLLQVQTHSCARASSSLGAVTECSPCACCPGNSCKVLPHPQKAREQEIRALHRLQSRRPWADLVSLITAAQFTQPVEKQTVCWLICLIPWLMAQGRKLGSTEESTQKTGFESNTHHRGLWPGTNLHQDWVPVKALSPQLAAAPFSLLVLDFTNNHKGLLVSSLEYESLVT